MSFSESDDEEGLAIEKEVLAKALQERARRSARSSQDDGPEAEANPKKAPRAQRKTVPGYHDPADRGPIKLSYEELIDLLPYFGKEDKRRLQKQLLEEDRGPTFVNTMANKDTTWSELPAFASARARSSASSSSQGSKEPSSSSKAKVQNLAASLEPEKHRPKAALKAELEEWRREIYCSRRDKHGRLRPSSCAPPPKGAQMTCPHVWDDLRWGANGSAQYAKCSSCLMKHVIYYDTMTNEVLMVSNAAAPKEEKSEPAAAAAASTEQSPAAEHTTVAPAP